MKERPEPKKHPAYGMALFSRGHGSRSSRHDPMFGSALETHYTTVRLYIERGQWTHELSSDHYYGTGEELIAVEFTSAQFVELITNMNNGSGVPCTIRHVKGERIPNPPPIETEVQRIKSTFGDQLKERVAEMKTRRKEVEKLTAGLSAKARNQLRIELDCMVMQLESNIPFVMDQFHEASDNVVTAAKQEIEAFAIHRVQMAGTAALAEQQAAPKLLGNDTAPRCVGVVDACGKVCTLPGGHWGPCS